MSGYLATLRVRLTAEIEELRRRLRDSGGLVDRFAGAAATTLTVVTAAFVALGIAASATTGKAIEFNRAISEVATVADPAQIDALTASVNRLSLQFGGTAAAQAKGLYEIISAGTADAAAATDTLNQANKLAIGGVTTVKTAADGLTSAMNAYGAAAGGAQSVSDSFFVAAAAGKTTIEQLSSNIGRVAPLAAAVKIPLDEVTAAIAALTKGGIATGPAVAGLAQIISSVIKPSQEAAETAAAIGLEFNAVALQSKGLAGFLADVAEKTKGNTTAMGLLFGGVEALVPALALSTTGAGDFASALEAMGNKAGATDRAYAIMAGSMEYRIARLQAQVSAQSVRIGSAILNAVIPAAEAIAANAIPILENLGTVLTVVAAVAIGRLVPAFIASTASAVRLGIAFLATATRAGIMAAATRGLAGALNAVKTAAAFFGGPWGVAITAVLAAVGLAFFNAGRKAREGARAMEEAAQRADAALAAMSDTAVSQAFVGAVDNVTRVNESLEEARRRLGVLQALAADGIATKGAAQWEVGVTGVDRFGEQTRGRVLTAFGRDLAAARENVRLYEESLTRARAEQERLGAASHQRLQAQAASVTLPDLSGAGTIDLGGAEKTAEKAASAVELLVGRVQSLTAANQSLRDIGQDNTAVQTALAAAAREVEMRLAAVRNVAGLAPEALKEYTDLLAALQQIRTATDVGEIRLSRFLGVDVVQLAAGLKEASAKAGAEYKRRMAEAAAAVAERLAKATDGLRTAMRGIKEDLAAAVRQLEELSFGAVIRRELAGAAAAFADAFDKVKKARFDAVDAGKRPTGFAALPPIPAAAAIVALSEVVAGAMSVLGPALQAFLLPLRLSGEILAKLITPILRLLFPLFKTGAVALTYLVQVVGYVGGALLKVIGEAVAAIGDLISRVPGLGQEGGAIEKFGRGMVRSANELFELAKSMPGVREELRAMTWADAMDRVADGAERVSRGMIGMVQGLKVSEYAFRAATAHAPRGTLASVAAPSASRQPAAAPAAAPVTYVYQGGPVTVNVPEGSGITADEVYKLALQAGDKAVRSDPKARAFWSQMPRPAF
jgi:TP901 family phage tail tape measure protein